jgi:TPR repeat protein
MPSLSNRLLHRRAVPALLLALAALAALPAHAHNNCNNDTSADAGSGAVSDLSLTYWVDQPAGLKTCAYGYYAAKCGDFEAAHKIFDKCIAAGYGGAMIWKGLLLENGSGVPRDLGAAAAMFKRAADSGNEGYATLGKLHYASALYEGRGVPRDEAEARRWFERAAAEGSEDAQTFLKTGHHTGSRNERGEGVGTPVGAVAAAQSSTQRLIKQAAQALPPGPAGLGLGLVLGLLALSGAGAWHQRRRASAVRPPAASGVSRAGRTAAPSLASPTPTTVTAAGA